VSVSLQEISVGGTLYESVPGISTIEPGKSYVSADIGAMEKSGATSSPLSNLDPTATLALLEQQGATVTSLGSSNIDGVDVTGYQVDLSNAQIQSKLQDIPSWLRQAASQIDFSGLTYDVYVDGSNQIRRCSVTTQITVAGQTVSANVDEDLSQYGDPVSISAPPAYQVVSLQQFLQDAEGFAGP
jgi:hypothetical protein